MFNYIERERVNWNFLKYGRIEKRPSNSYMRGTTVPAIMNATVVVVPSLISKYGCPTDRYIKVFFVSVCQ